jgi:uncharacterized protein YggU (UPF0235/DUF167 family)
MNISVRVHPNAKNPREEKDLLGQLHIYVKAPPQEGKANKAAIIPINNSFELVIFLKKFIV